MMQDHSPFQEHSKQPAPCTCIYACITRPPLEPDSWSWEAPSPENDMNAQASIRYPTHDECDSTSLSMPRFKKLLRSSNREKCWLKTRRSIILCYLCRALSNKVTGAGDALLAGRLPLSGFLFRHVLGASKNQARMSTVNKPGAPSM